MPHCALYRCPGAQAGLAVLLGLATLGFCLTGNIGTATDDTGAVFEASKLLDGLPTTLALFLLLGALYLHSASITCMQADSHGPMHTPLGHSPL